MPLQSHCCFLRQQSSAIRAAASSPSAASQSTLSMSTYLPAESKVLLATCSLNQWALDFDGNLRRVEESIRRAKQQGATYRLGPELELCGYSCEDHFFELDTFLHCEQSLATILSGDLTDGILCDIGMPVMHRNVRYNCRVFCLDRKIVLIRPKVYLADDGNYRERRYFTSWKQARGCPAAESYSLSELLASVTGQSTAPMGVCIIQTRETMLAAEVCEELWAPDSPHVSLMLAGAEIVTNGSGSHHQLRKLQSRLSLMQGASAKCGGAYLYSNQRGCDGNRLYFDGSALICVNGSVLRQGSQFGLQDVEVLTAVIDLDDIRSYRNKSASVQEQSSAATAAHAYPIIDLRGFSLSQGSGASSTAASRSTTAPVAISLHSAEEECCLGPACWLWDYLRRSGASGYLLPLSGGADSAAVAGIVKVMCDMVAAEIKEGNIQVTADALRIVNSSEDSSTAPVAAEAISAEVLCNAILHSVYMATENSSNNTRSRAERIAQSIGAYHSSLSIDLIISSILQVFSTVSGGLVPRFLTRGGGLAEDLALQNIQARTRMVTAYLCAGLLPWVRRRRGFLLVLGSANVDEALRGYMTKYDCSSADVNPIGGICKKDLKSTILFIANKCNLPVLAEVVAAAPSAELRPLENAVDANDYSQTDEEDMGMSYDELGVFGYLRKCELCGPVQMFKKLVPLWGAQAGPQGRGLSLAEIAAKVKRFFYFYAINRHKMTTLTPSYHAESYSPDDNRFDLRPFLYNARFERQFNTIDSILETYNQ